MLNKQASHKNLYFIWASAILDTYLYSLLMDVNASSKPGSVWWTATVLLTPWTLCGSMSDDYNEQFSREMPKRKSLSLQRRAVCTSLFHLVSDEAALIPTCGSLIWKMNPLTHPFGPQAPGITHFQTSDWIRPLNPLLLMAVIRHTLVYSFRFSLTPKEYPYLLLPFLILFSFWYQSSPTVQVSTPI